MTEKNNINLVLYEPENRLIGVQSASCTSSRSYEEPETEPIYISRDSQRADGMTKILSGKALIDSQGSLNVAVPSSLLELSQEEGQPEKQAESQQLGVESTGTATIGAFKIDKW